MPTVPYFHPTTIRYVALVLPIPTTFNLPCYKAAAADGGLSLLVAIPQIPTCPCLYLERTHHRLLRLLRFSQYNTPNHHNKTFTGLTDRLPDLPFLPSPSLRIRPICSIHFAATHRSRTPAKRLCRNYGALLRVLQFGPSSSHIGVTGPILWSKCLKAFKWAVIHLTAVNEPRCALRLLVPTGFETPFSRDCFPADLQHALPSASFQL